MNSQDLLVLLADGEFHSGEQIGAQSGLTRAAVWKQMRKLEKWGLRIEACSGRGYRLSQPLDLLDPQWLAVTIGADERFDLDTIDVFTEADSTNRFLMHNPPSRSETLRVCLAEWQSAGRGRLERQWDSPLGTGICMSAGWAWEGTPREFSALSLAAGAAIASAISAQCDIAVQLKWPNDIVWNGRKLGGVLVESRIESHGHCHVVIGVGINVTVAEADLARLSDWRAGAADLRTAMRDRTCSRNVLSCAIASALGALLAQFDQRSALSWLQTWRSLDFLRGKPIRVGSQSKAFEGVADGIDDDGALLVIDAAGTTQRVVAGDASVRTTCS
jgi:BirA family biotin operon repressor/biotin-[acetyl-CoA-carboxylase] ligase